MKRYSHPILLFGWHRLLNLLSGRRDTSHGKRIQCEWEESQSWWMSLILKSTFLDEARSPAVPTNLACSFPGIGRCRKVHSRCWILSLLRSCFWEFHRCLRWIWSLLGHRLQNKRVLSSQICWSRKYKNKKWMFWKNHNKNILRFLRFNYSLAYFAISIIDVNFTSTGRWLVSTWSSHYVIKTIFKLYYICAVFWLFRLWICNEELKW